MDLDLRGRCVLVSGASRGIGFATAQACLAEGAKVALVARNEANLDAARASLESLYGRSNVWATTGDMRETEVIEQVLESAENALGPLWGVVANVGLGETPYGLEVGDETWRAGMGQNLDAAYRLARGALRRMLPQKQGSFVFVSSIAGLAAIGMPLSYSTAKAAVNQLTKELARLTGKDGVRVNAVAPGNILFPGSGWEDVLASDEGDDWADWIRREVPMQRLGSPEEIGTAIAFLLSPRASFVHGSIMVVDGGQTR